MNAVAKSTDWISPEEYLEGEKTAKIRHEYVDGQVFAMAGTSADHSRIAGNLFHELSLRLRGGSCEVFRSDLKLRIPEPANVYYYPDVMVVCDSSDNAEYHRERPSYVFEVILPQTERIDRREKMLAYRQIPGIEGYIILEQEQIQVTVMCPAAGAWRTETLRGLDATLELRGLKIEIPLSRIYERTSVATNESTHL